MTVALDVTSRIAAAIRDVPDFPKQGIVFKDITPVLLDPRLFREATEAMAAPFAGHSISHVVAIESRGFILGAPVAQVLGAAFVPFRKRCDDAADALERVVVPLFAFFLMKTSRRRNSYVESAAMHASIVEALPEKSAAELREMVKQSLAGWKDEMMHLLFSESS